LIKQANINPGNASTFGTSPWTLGGIEEI